MPKALDAFACMEDALIGALNVSGYGFQPGARIVLERLLDAASLCSPPPESRCCGMQMSADNNAPDSIAGRAVWSVAVGDAGATLEGIAYEEASPAVASYIRSPGVTSQGLGRVFAALRPAWARAIMLGPIRVSMNARVSPHKGTCSVQDLYLKAYCQCCKSTEDLEGCEACSVVAYCRNGDCKQRDLPRHNAWCTDLLVSRLLWCALPPEALKLQELARRSPLTPYGLADEAALLAAMQVPPSWEVYFQERWPRTSSLERLLLTESLSSPLTLVKALDALGLRNRFDGKAALRVLVVGADCEADQPWVELLRYLPCDLELVMVGPYLEDERSIALEAGGRRVTLSCHKGLLQDLNKLGAFDMAVAFNSGMIFYDTWPAALNRIIALRCPLVVTAWALTESVGVRSLLVDAGFESPKFGPNAFASRCPHRVTDDHGTTPFGNLCLLVTAPRHEPVWAEYLREGIGGGAPHVDDIEDALRLMQGHLEVAVGAEAELETILSYPGYYDSLLKRCEADGRPVPTAVANDLAEARRLLAALSPAVSHASGASGGGFSAGAGAASASPQRQRRGGKKRA